MEFRRVLFRSSGSNETRPRSAEPPGRLQTPAGAASAASSCWPDWKNSRLKPLLQGSRGNQPAGRSGQTVFASSSSSQSKTSAPSSSSSETKLNTLREYISLLCSAPLLARFSRPATVTPLLRSEEHTSELQSLIRISYAVSCLKKNK